MPSSNDAIKFYRIAHTYFLLKINVHKELMPNTKTCDDFDSFFFLYLKYNFGSVISFAVQLSTRSMNGFDVFMYVGEEKMCC